MSVPARIRQRDERAVAGVPRPVLLLLGAALACQIGWHLASAPDRSQATDLPPPPTAAVLHLVSFGEPALAARVAMLYLQSFDLHAGNELPYQRLDYGLLTRWLQVILETDPLSEYPLFAAARIYAEVPQAAKMRRMIEFIHDRFLEDPNRRWPWLAHAALLAKHRLHDLPLACRYAADVARLVSDPTLPLWAREMEGFILEDMGEIEAARIMLGGLVASGRIKDGEELRFLELRLRQLEERLQAGKPH